MRARALYWQFCWDLVPSKLTTHRYYKLLRTRSWSNRISKVICWQQRKSIRPIGYICGQEVVASWREKRVVFRAELPQNKYLTYASLIQWQLPDLRIGEEHVTCCAPVLVEIDKELRSRSEAYLLTHLLLTTPVPIARMQAWVTQHKHAQLLQMAFVMKNKWELLLPSSPWAVRDPSRYEVDSSLPKGIKACQIVVSACDTWLLFLVIACFY